MSSCLRRNEFEKLNRDFRNQNRFYSLSWKLFDDVVSHLCLVLFFLTFRSDLEPFLF